MLGAKEVTYESGHPYQRGLDRGATEVALLEAFKQCLERARKSGTKKCTRFVYFDMGTTKKNEKFFCRRGRQASLQ
jgi:hypothetical protein